MLFQLDATFFHGTGTLVDFDLYHMIQRYISSHNRWWTKNHKKKETPKLDPDTEKVFTLLYTTYQLILAKKARKVLRDLTQSKC